MSDSGTELMLEKVESFPLSEAKEGWAVGSANNHCSMISSKDCARGRVPGFVWLR